MSKTGNQGQTKGCVLSFFLLLITGCSWLYFDIANWLAKPRASWAHAMAPDKYGKVNSRLLTAMILISVLLPVILWLGRKGKYAKGAVAGILIFWLLVAILALINHYSV